LLREGQRVQEQVAAKIRELEARNQALTETEDFLNQRVKQLSVISRQYVDIQRELKIATENLNQFLTKREALRIDAGQRETPWQILTAVGEPIRSAGNTRQSAILGAILGMLLGVGLALLLDKLRDVLHGPDDAKEAAGLPLLGVIPHNPELQEIEQIALVTNIAGLMQQVRGKLPVPGFAGKPDRYGASPFLEAFRSLYTNIRLLNSDTLIRSLIITSATPGDGKSTTALYLAQAAAALGQRVLLVDTDLRRPQLHERLKLENDLGLSNVISSDLNFEKVLQRSPLEANLSILTAGLIPPDPTRLLSSQKMQNLMEQFQNSFDLVIYDTPPVLGLADAKLIASKTDGIIMVVGLASTRRSALTQALDALKLSPVGVLGIVANGSRENSTAFYQNYLKYYSTTDPALLEPDTTFTVKPTRGFDYDN
jgi:capsular exopolysaccharide synthesis family protein